MTTQIYQTEFQIAAGYNNAAGLVNIETIIVANQRILPVRAYAFYDVGERRARADGLSFFRGFQVAEWQFGRMTRLQHEELSDLYCNGGISGLVTIRTSTNRTDTFANFNAILDLPKNNEVTHVNADIPDYRMLFRRLVAI